ncbi:hypothetical protein JTE90_002922 [Oedothorax gibbosus]|uniref:C2H2-type domain-containing protein n=1 Tax=Oedothorax gibbosus TaxID=931172 RepID=A0AAV6UVQ2_9ARAC|nr:hypothetical protein JTE90_002922 [Oedothorax gibbosus]
MLPKRVTLICREKIVQKDQIEAHAPNHSVNVSYICGICCEQFNEKTKLEKRFSIHTKEECQIYTSSMEVLKKCIKTGPFNRKTRQISLFEKHQLKSQSPESMLYVCQICSKRFEDVQQLKKHSLIHTKNKHLCQMCFKSFKTRRQLIAHSVTHKTKTEAPFACQVCSKQYPTEKQLQKHFRTHTDMFTHKCQECDKVFANRANLRKHMGYHTRHHVCNVCGDSFTQKSFLRLHKFAHSQEEQIQSVSNDESLYTCEICRKVFNTKRELLKHCVLHGGENFDCGVCGKSFSNAVNLRGHFVIHEDKIFPCLVCDKTFPQKQQLISHSITHTREKNFFCGTCEKAFIRRGNLRLHCLSHKDDTENVVSK